MCLTKFSSTTKTILSYYMFTTGPTMAFLPQYTMRSFDFPDVQKWLSLQEVCNPGYVLSIKALYRTSYGLTIVFTEPVKYSLSSWVTKIKREQMPHTDPVTGYITPFLCSIYSFSGNILTLMIHVLDCTGDSDDNVTLDNIWLRNGSIELGCPKFSGTGV
ncbi:unnamed protein product, partial [Prunus brigantina]